MPLQNFVDGTLPTIKAAWLNAIDSFYFTLFNSATTPAAARTALGAGAFGSTMFATADASAGRVALDLPSVGQCQLNKSGANLVLTPKNGQYLMINGVLQKVPAAGVTLAPTGAVASTFYYVYAFMNSGTMTLEFSTTVPAVDSTYGIKIKNADATRSLVGGFYCLTNNTFTDTATQRYVMSWYNRRRRTMLGQLATNQANTSTSFVNLSANMLLEFVGWDEDTFGAAFTGSVFNATNNAYLQSRLAVDANDIGAQQNGQVVVTSQLIPIGVTRPDIDVGTTGYHNVSAQGCVSAGTGQWLGIAGGNGYCAITAGVFQ